MISINQIIFLLISMLSIFVSREVIAKELPEFYGIYIQDSGIYKEIRNELDASIKVTSYPEKIRILVFKKNLQLLADSLHIQPIVFVRNKVTMSRYYQNQVDEVTKYGYWRIDPNKRIPYRSAPIPGRNEMILLVPRNPLPPGAYAVTSGRNKTLALFMIMRSEFDADITKTILCRDIVVSNAFSLTMGDNGRLVPCSENALAQVSKPETVHKNKSKENSDIKKQYYITDVLFNTIVRKPVASREEYVAFLKAENERVNKAIGIFRLFKYTELRNRANQAYLKGDCQKALQFNNEILNMDQKNFFAKSVLADCYLKQGNLEKSVHYLHDTLQSLRASFLYILTAEALAMDGQETTALKILKKGLDAGAKIDRIVVVRLSKNFTNDEELWSMVANYGITR